MRWLIKSKRIKITQLINLTCIVVSLSLLIIGISGCNSIVPQSMSSTPDLNQMTSSIPCSEISDNSLPTTEPSKAEESSSSEFGLPKMTEENQKYYDKYLGIFWIGNPFGNNFNNNDFSEANAFSAGVIYKNFAKMGDSDVNEELVESTIQKYFYISAEDMRKLAGPAYDERRKIYIVPSMESKELSYYVIKGVIISSELKGDTLSLTCDWYNAKGTEPPDISYTLQWASIVTVQIQSEKIWKYKSNQIIDVYDPEHYAYSLFHS